jgi:hypothetical protein
MHRIRREGFLRVKLAPLFGFYPWRCSSCGAEHMFRERGERKRKPDPDNAHE